MGYITPQSRELSLQRSVLSQRIELGTQFLVLLTNLLDGQLGGEKTRGSPRERAFVRENSVICVRVSD